MTEDDRTHETSPEHPDSRRADESGAAGATSSASQPQAGTSPDAAKLRELVLKANPDVIPEMIAGSSLDELMASIEPARAAYQRIVQSVQSSGANVPKVPAGGGQRQFVVNIEELSPSAKISEGLRQRKRSSSAS